jgi:two-component system response regulator (stage 0 sporulation protein F)
MKPTRLILVVDDGESYRLVLRHHLEALGYQVEEAEDGAQGCSIASRKPFELIILDMIMPKTEGLETISRLRRAGIRTKILAISGAGRAREYLKLACKLGADAEVEKIMPISALLSLVQSLTENSNPTACCP